MLRSCLKTISIFSITKLLTEALAFNRIKTISWIHHRCLMKIVIFIYKNTVLPILQKKFVLVWSLENTAGTIVTKLRRNKDDFSWRTSQFAKEISTWIVQRFLKKIILKNGWKISMVTGKWNFIKGMFCLFNVLLSYFTIVDHQIDKYKEF